MIKILEKKMLVDIFSHTFFQTSKSKEMNIQETVKGFIILGKCAQNYITDVAINITSHIFLFYNHYYLFLYNIYCYI